MAEPSSRKPRTMQITHNDIMSMILNGCDVPEVLAMRSISKDFKNMISTEAFIRSYNVRERSSPWVFSYSVVAQEQQQVGFVYGLRFSDRRRVTLGPFEDGANWRLLDMCGSLMLFFEMAYPPSLVVVNPITMTVQRVGLPDDFPEDALILDEGEYNVSITTDAAGYKIVYLQVVNDELCYFQYQSSDGGSWAKSVLVRVDRMTVEVEQRRNIVLSVTNDDDDQGVMLYTFFHRAGNDVPVYKVTSKLAGEFEIQPLVDFGDDTIQSWYYCGRMALFIDYHEQVEENGQNTIDVMSMCLYKRNANGSVYDFLVDVPNLMPLGIVFASVSMKELNGVLYFALQTRRVGANVAATRYVYRYQIEDGEFLERLEFPPLANGRHSRAVFTTRLTMPEP